MMLDVFLFLLIVFLFTPILVGVSVIGAHVGMFFSERVVEYLKDKFGES